ncbi:hypothetical protein KXD40_007605 [Peronospora effusa]|nr:hypothetical protein KXD40_007605 [Peronospora effusa]
MLRVPLGKDLEIHMLPMRPKASKSTGGLWLHQNLAIIPSQPLAPLVHKNVAGIDQERPASSPCPSSSSSSNSKSSIDFSPHSSGNTSDSEEEAPAANGGGGDDQKEKKEDTEDGNSSDSSCTSNSSVQESESEKEEDDNGVLIDTNKDKITYDGVDPTDDDDSEESDGNSDLENSYPRLPPAPVDTLIKSRQQEAYKDLQLTEKMKQKVISDARQRHQERQQAQRSKKKTPNSKRQRSKSDVVSNKSTRLERRHSSTDVVKTQQEQEGDEWMVDCSCGVNKKNYDDGTSMIECDSCSHWVHAKCADKQPETVAREKFLCFRCCWMFDCVCSVRRQPNHDDGQRMVECESCKTWQHTECVRIPMTEEPADDYRCPRCVRKARRRKSAAKGSRSRDRQRKRSHAKSSRPHPKSTDTSPVAAMKVRSSARSLDTLTTSTRSHRSKRFDIKTSSKMDKKGATAAPALSSPPRLAVSPASTPPPPSSPPPPSVVSSRAHSGYAKHDRDRGHIKRRSERKEEHSSGSNALSCRTRCRSLGSCQSSAEKTHSDSSEKKHYVAPQTGVTPSPRGKGFMLRGYSPAAARTSASSSRAVDTRPPLPLIPPSAGASSGNNNNSHNSHGRKRNVSSARDRLAKKLKIRKSSLR